LSRRRILDQRRNQAELASRDSADDGIREQRLLARIRDESEQGGLRRRRAHFAERDARVAGARPARRASSPRRRATSSSPPGCSKKFFRETDRGHADARIGISQRDEHRRAVERAGAIKRPKRVQPRERGLLRIDGPSP